MATVGQQVWWNVAHMSTPCYGRIIAVDGYTLTVRDGAGYVHTLALEQVRFYQCR